VTGVLRSTAIASSRRRRSRKSNRVSKVSRLSENNSNTVVLPIGAATRIAVIVGLARLTIHRMGTSPACFLTGAGTIAKMPVKDPEFRRSNTVNTRCRLFGGPGWCEEIGTAGTRAQFLYEKPGPVAGGVRGRDDPGPLAAIDQDHRCALRRRSLTAPAGGGEGVGDLRHLGGAELAIAANVLPALPARSAELAGEIEALDMIGVVAALAAIMVRDQRPQGDRPALAGGHAVAKRRDVPDGERGVEVRR